VPTVTDFRDFEAFEACRAFARETVLLVRTRKFGPNRRLIDQMERASISILSNFAEGFEREGNSEFIQFLAISKGSIGELRAQLIYSLDLGLLQEPQYNTLDEAAESATRLVGGLMRYLSGSAKRGRKYDRKLKRRRLLRSRTKDPRGITAKRKANNRKLPTSNRQRVYQCTTELPHVRPPPKTTSRM
jgi:four helix bundle protein